MAQRKTKQHGKMKVKLRPEQRKLARRLKQVHRQLIPANVQKALGPAECYRDMPVLSRWRRTILKDTILRANANKSIDGLSQHILDTAHPACLVLIHSTFLSALQFLPDRECRLDPAIDLAIDVMQWYERQTRREPLPPSPEGPGRDGMAAALKVA